MKRAWWPIGLERPARIDVALLAVVAALTLVTCAMVAVPSLRVRFVAPELDLVLDTVTTFVTVSVAALIWIRFRELGEPVALFQSAAFLAFGIGNCLTLLLVTSGLDREAGMSLEQPGQAPLYVFGAVRILAGALLVVGTFESLRGRQPARPRLIMFGSATVTILAIVAAQMYAETLPFLGSASPLSRATGGPASIPSLPAMTVLGALIQVLGAALFLWAAALSRRLYLRNRSIGDGFVAVGLVFAAFAQVQAALYPSTYAGVVTGGDFLRIAFDVILLLGIQAAARVTLSELRVANIDLARLRGIEVDRAAVDERSRLSRELHDGLAQDLWLAKLKTSRLAGIPDLGPEATALTAELGSAIDAGLAEAQQAVTALRTVGSPGSPLRELLVTYVDDFADRFGLRVEITCDPRLPWLTARTQAEVVRIVQEALNNVRRHADATLVRVRLAAEDQCLVVVVADNGCGFDPAATGKADYGLASMHERAELIGGRLKIHSRPRDGTRVTLELPLAMAAMAGTGLLT